MKAKLIKTDKGYGLVSSDKTQPIASTLNPHDSLKLSKKNCDSLFGVVDVEKLAEEEYKSHASNEDLYGDSEELQLAYKAGVVDGFNKAMELNKDKVFTNQDMIVFGLFCINNIDCFTSVADELFPKFQSLQQPTEIEVEIVMGDSIGISDLYTPDNNPKLDSDGCLTLTKKI